MSCSAIGWPNTQVTMSACNAMTRSSARCAARCGSDASSHGMKCMSAECFIDTNLFIYQLEALDARKTATADHIIRRGIETGNPCISFQVVQECLNTVLRKAEIPLDTDQTRAYLEAVLAPLFQVSASIPLYQ